MATKTKILGLMLATAVGLASPMLVWADNGDVKPVSDEKIAHHDGDWFHAKHEHMMAQILNLSEDQEKQLKDIKQKKREAKKSIFEQIKANREAFEAEIVKATPDMTKINDTQTQLKAIQSQMVDNHLNFILEIKKLLTPEQFAGYMALEKEEDMMKMEGRHKFGHREEFGKGGEGHEHWGDKSDEEHEADSK